MKPLAISIGDPAGVGPEILNYSLETLGRAVIFAPSYLKPTTLPENIQWESFAGEPQSLGAPSLQSGQQAYESFFQAAQAVEKGHCSALVTLPLSKEYVALSHDTFRGHTEVLGEWWGGDPLMMLTGGSLKVALVTHHLPLSQVSKNVTVEKIVSCGEILKNALKKWWKLNQPELHLLALNPHAGDGGFLGKEEQEILNPALKKLQQLNSGWTGVHSADSFFARGNWSDAVLAMYHDQGLIPVKMLSQGMGTNITLGLPHIRVSPDHGTAFDIAGKGLANPRAFQEAVKQAREFMLIHESEQVARQST